MVDIIKSISGFSSRKLSKRVLCKLKKYIKHNIDNKNAIEKNIAIHNKYECLFRFHNIHPIIRADAVSSIIMTVPISPKK